MTEVNFSECKKATGFSLFDLISLTGIFGVYDPDTFFDLLDSKKLTCKICLNSKKIPIIQISDSPDIEKLVVIVQSPDEIFIDLFKKEPTSKIQNIGFRRLISQVITATQLKFKRIRLWAYGSISEFGDWDGYIVWGKYGFLMYRNDDISKFNSKMSEDFLIHCSTIYDLVKSKEGTAYWKYRGESWYGELNLAANSQHMNAYREYGRSKKLLI